MSQRQFTNYQSDILSFELREAMLGIITSGRYGGYTEFTEDVVPSGGIIHCTLGHGTGVSKSDHAASPTLVTGFGVAVTAQGIVIHEDQDLAIDIADNDGETNPRWDVIVMEHIYDDASGDNPALYTVTTGTPAASPSIPIIDDTNTGAIIGYLYIPGNATTFAELAYYPAQTEQQYGDIGLFQKLFGDTTPEILSTNNIGVVPTDGVIGKRDYTENNFLVNGESITDSLDMLDMEIQDNFEELTTIGNRSLEDASWGSLTYDSIEHNATSLHHGLLPRLSGISGEFLSGTGGWANPTGKRLVWRDSVTTGDFDKTDFGNFAATSGTLDLSSLVPADCDIAWVRIFMLSELSSITSEVYLSIKKSVSTGGSASLTLPASGSAEQTDAVLNTIIGLDSNREFYWTSSGDAAADLSSIVVMVLAWQTTD